MRDEEKLLQKRFMDLANQAYYNDTFCFTNFLSMADVDLLLRSDINTTFELFGGANGCERMVARFGSKEELGYEVPYPIVILQIEPILPKFAETLSHRDFLGALMNLGMERDMIGDIWIVEKSAYLFLIDSMAEYVMQNLDKVRHTNMKVKRLEEVPATVSPTLEEKVIIAASKRLDVVIAKIYGLSRSKVIPLFEQNKVFINGRLETSNSRMLKDSDVIAVRGFGKFIFEKENYETKKGRLCLNIKEYV